MGAKTQKQIKQEIYKKAYFFYWKLQNNPEYVEFYREWKAFEDEYQKDPQKALREVDPGILDRSKAIKAELGVRVTYVDPFRKIDWDGFKTSNIPDPAIIRAFSFSENRPIKSINETKIPRKLTVQFLQDWEQNPFLNLSIDLRHDKKETLLRVSELIDEFRKTKKIKPYNRDHIKKFYIYAQTWDLRKGPDRLAFPEISRKTGTKLSTVKGRFYRAFELIYGKKYDPNVFEKTRHTVYRETLKQECSTCKERKTCSTPCPDVLRYIMQDERKQNYLEIQASEKDFVTLSHLGLTK